MGKKLLLGSNWNHISPTWILSFKLWSIFEGPNLSLFWPLHPEGEWQGGEKESQSCAEFFPFASNSKTFLCYQESFKDLSNGSKVLPSRPVRKKGFVRNFDRMSCFDRKKKHSTFNKNRLLQKKWAETSSSPKNNDIKWLLEQKKLQKKILLKTRCCVPSNVSTLSTQLKSTRCYTHPLLHPKSLQDLVELRASEPVVRNLPKCLGGRPLHMATVLGFFPPGFKL